MPISSSNIMDFTNGQSGLLMLDNNNAPVAFVPVDYRRVQILRRDGRMDSLYRALSMSNASKVVIVNQGEMKSSAMYNLVAFFNHLGLHLQDIVENEDGQVYSRREHGLVYDHFRTFKQGPVAPADNAVLEDEADEPPSGSTPPEATGRQKVLADTQALLEWFGLKSLDDWYKLDFESQRRYHEQFATAFEQYLLEGKAPSLALRDVFEQFRVWLLHVYRSLRGLNVNLSGEVRGVFDRMLASDAEIRLAQQAAAMQPLFSSAGQAGMNDRQFADYQAMDKAARDSAGQNLQSRALADMQWLQQAHSSILNRMQQQHRQLRQAVYQQVRRKVWSKPVYQLWDYLSSPQGGKISLADLRQMQVAEPVIQQLQKLGMLDETAGLHPQQLAGRYGFRSGPVLIKALTAAPQPEQLIRQLADAEMLQNHALLSSPAAIQQAAMRAVHNHWRAKLVAAEAQALAVAAGDIRLHDQAVHQYAVKMLASQKLADIHPQQYLRAEVRAALAASQYFQAGDLEQAAQAKRQQLINLYAVMEAYRIRELLASGLQHR